MHLWLYHVLKLVKTYFLFTHSWLDGLGGLGGVLAFTFIMPRTAPIPAGMKKMIFMRGI